MNKNWKNIVALAILCLLLALPAIAEGPARLADVTFQTDAIVLQPQASAKAFALRVTGPGDFVYDATFGAGEAISFGFDAADAVLLDGLYSFELTAVPARNKASVEALTRGLENARAERLVQSGSFTILDGAIVDPYAAEKPAADAGLTLKVRSADTTLETKDQVILDDLIVDGSICAGQDCVNGESFGFDTIRLKENNLRIKFQDTSNSASFPTNDWQLTANDSSNGGANKFSIDDIDGGRTPFTIEASAPSHSLYVDDGGRIGFGTSTPVVQMHLVDGNTPTLRLEQDGSSGFTAQTWDVAGNETNFFIRDATNGSTLPFRIRPGAPTSALDIQADGDVGMGTTSPDSPLHVVETTAGDRTMLHVTANGTPRIQMTNSGNTAVDWSFSAVGTGLRFTDVQDGAIELEIDNAGNVDILGQLTVCKGASACTPETTYPDYVFEDGYNLMPLDHLAAFIAENKHLPSVPTVAHVMENGINLTELQLKTLEKVEELTLYTLQQEEVIRELKARLAALEGENE